MSDYLAAAAAAVGGPEDLVSRSAGARAAAQGVAVEDILKAWAGGEAVAASAPAATAVEPEAPLVAEASTSMPAEVPALATVEVAEPVVATPVAVIMYEAPVEPIEPADLRDRILFPGKLGAIVGAMFGMLVSVGAGRFLSDGATLAGSEGAVQTVLNVNPPKLLLGAVVVSAVFGSVIARLSGIVPAWFDPGLSVRTSARTNTLLGGAIGAVLGVVGGGILLSLGSPLEALGGDAESITQLSILSTMVTVLAGGAVLGAITAVSTQVLALPAGLTDAEEEESELIKHRLITSYLMPVMVVVGIAALVLPFGYLLVTFHTFAPILAIVAASGILGFAGLSASRPGMKITAGEFLVAAAGIGALLMIVALVANATGGDVAHTEGLRLILGG